MNEYPDWLTKQQVADALQVTTKTVERYADAGKLQKASRRSPAGGPDVVVYHPADVARLVQERRPAATAFVLPVGSDPHANGNGHRHPDAPSAAVALAQPLGPGDDPVRALFAAALRAVMSQTSETSTPCLYVSIPEAAQLSGLSQAYLKRAIAAGTLPAVRDRGWRIRRRDLEAL